MIWAGTDDGNIQVTRDGGVTWTNVTPPSIKPWTRIFNIEAGHFDPLVAYAAANTLRLDEIAPHFYRTRDGGKSWTEINTGIAGDAVANTIREDPRQPGLLFAGTDTQVWVSFDDGGSLAVAAAQHAGDLGPRSADQGRREVPLRRSDRGHARARLLDSRRCHATSPGGGDQGGARQQRAVSGQARTGGAGALRRQRSDAVAPRAPGGRERAARRSHRLLPAA